MLIAAILLLLIWLYLLFFHAGFWRVDRFRLSTCVSASEPLVAVIIPARDEAEVIGRAVSSVLRQEFGGEIRVFIVDDNSSDGTANVARAAAALLGLADKLTVIRGSELPAGWSGKVWAMQQGWHVASKLHPDYVFFTDADVEHSTKNLERLLAQAEHGQNDLVSLMVKLRCETLAEKFLIPAFVYFFFLLYPPSRVVNRAGQTAGAAGGCMLLRRELLERIGGLESIRSEIIDDCALAKRIKQAGGRLWLGISEDTRSIRGYGSFSNIRDMIARSAFNQLYHSSLLLVGCLFGMTLVFILPLLLVFTENTLAGWIAALTCILMFVSYAPTLRLYRVNVLFALTLPFAAIFYMYATIVSAGNYWRGKGGVWKGRAQDSA